jgi:hypothetical protein
LLTHHWEQLPAGSGILPEIVAERGYRSITGPEQYQELKALGFARTRSSH